MLLALQVQTLNGLRCERFLLVSQLATETFGCRQTYEGWNFNSGNYLFTTDKK